MRRRPAISMLVLIAVVMMGAAVRVREFLSGRSLWYDESLLALNLIDRPLHDALERLAFAQATPAAWFVVELGVSKVAGYSEEALRSPPLIAGVAALVLFAILARRVFTEWNAVVATVMFAASDGLVSYASELKPYASDALVTVVLLLLGLAVLERAPSARAALAIGSCGALAIVLSFPSVFVAASIAVAFLAPGRGIDWRDAVRPRLPVVLLWGLAVFVVLLDGRLRAATIRTAFKDDRMAFGDATGGGGVKAAWLDNFVSGLLHSLGLAQERPFSQLAKIALLAFVVGVVSLIRRRPAVGCFVALPFVATGLASLLHEYPVTARTTLFLSPLFILAIADGLSWPVRRLGGRRGLTVTVAALVAVVGFPLYSVGYHVAHPRTKEELRPVLEELRLSWRPGDTLYVHFGAQYALRYYADCACLGSGRRPLDAIVPLTRVEGRSTSSPALASSPPHFILGSRLRHDAARLRAALSPLHGRVWFVRSHADDVAEGAFLRKDVPRILDGLGTRLVSVERPGAVALLYEFP